MAADGTTFPPFQTIPDLAPASGLNFTDQVWINQAGVDKRANLQDIANLVLPLTVTAWNGRTGPVQMTLLDVTNVGGAPLTSPFFDGVPQAPTPPRGAADNRIATAQFVQDAIGSTVAGVASFNGRVGAVTLTTADITNAGGVTGGPFLPTTGGVLSGPGNLTVGGALIAAGGLAGSSATLTGDLSIGATKAANTVWAGPVSGPAAAPAWRQLSAADITGLPTGTVTSVGITAPANIVVSGSPVTGAGSIALSYAPQANNTVLAGPLTGGPSTPAFRQLTQADIQGGVGVTSVGLTAPTMFTVSGSPVTGAGSLGLTLTPQANSFVLAGPPSGGPSVPTFRQLTAADISGLTSGSVTSVGLAMPADFTVTNSPVTGAGTLTVTRNNQAANTVLAAPNGAAGAPTFRTLTQADITGGVGVTSVGLAMPSPFTVVGTNPITSSGNFTVTTIAQAANSVYAGPTSGGNGTPAFRALTSADIPSLSGLYLPLAGGVVSGPTTFNAIVTGNVNNDGFHAAGSAGAIRGYLIYTGSSPRWWLQANATAESGSNAGSDFVIERYSDGGTDLGAALTINRATGAATFSGTVTAKITAALPTGVGVIDIDGPAGISRALEFSTSGTARWTFGAGAAGESGSNTGSNLNLVPYDDTGVALPSALTVQRNTSVMSIAKLGVAGSTPGGVLIGQGTNAAATWTAQGGAGQFLAGVAGADPAFRQPSSADLSDSVGRTTFAPTVTFGTPGDLTVAYTSQIGVYMKVGALILFYVSLGFTPTYTTATGTICISLPPIAPTDLFWAWPVRQLSGFPSWPTGVTTFVARNQTVGGVGACITLAGQGSTIAGAQMTSTQLPSGTAVNVAFSGYYF